ncbi:MAG: hypothetical protein ACI4L7_01255 [Christensenellales bacterium]
MLNINFEVNKDVISRLLISKNDMPTDYANYLWQKYNASYREIHNAIFSKNIDNNILLELQEQPFFAKRLFQAKTNCKRIKRNWENKCVDINNFLNNIMKVDFDLNITAYIVDPMLYTGFSIKDNPNHFVWGNEVGLSDENYDLVYLVHESLHSLFKNDNLSHAIIENIADVELSKYLNNSKVGYEYHSYTKEEHVKAFPYWNLYLGKGVEEIKEQQELLDIQYSIKEIEHYREKLSKMNIFEFIDFLKPNIKNIKLKTYYELKLEEPSNKNNLSNLPSC